MSERYKNVNWHGSPPKPVKHYKYDAYIAPRDTDPTTFTDEEVYGKPSADRPLSIEEFFLADCKTDEERAEIASDIAKLKTGGLEL